METLIERINIACEISTQYVTKIKPSKRPKIVRSTDLVEVLRPVFGNDMDFREVFVVVYLSKANQILGIHRMFTGACDGVVYDNKMIFKGAFDLLASAIIIAHNHPSGNLKASQQDIVMAEKLSKQCTIMDMKLLDSLVLTSEGHYSFMDEGLL